MDSHTKTENAMKKEYLYPGVEVLDIQLEAPILAFSTDNLVIEDFEVSDGEW